LQNTNFTIENVAIFGSPIGLVIIQKVRIKLGVVVLNENDFKCIPAQFPTINPAQMITISTHFSVVSVIFLA